MPDRKLLPKNFFRDNEPKSISLATIVDFAIINMRKEEFNQELNDYVTQTLDADRIRTVSDGRTSIEAANTPEQIIQLMRQRVDPVNQWILCGKARSMEEELLPSVIQRYKRTLQEDFVESAVRIIGNSDRKYTEELFRDYNAIRLEYARAMACLLFGEFRIEESVQLLLKEYARFQREDNLKGYEQCPLFALCLLYGEYS